MSKDEIRRTLENAMDVIRGNAIETDDGYELERLPVVETQVLWDALRDAKQFVAESA